MSMQREANGLLNSGQGKATPDQGDETSMRIQCGKHSSAGVAGATLSSCFRGAATVFCLGLLLIATGLLSAQTVTGNLQGRVLDTTGAAIPEASVTAVNVATGLTRSATASAVGEYQFTGLPAGDYTVNA